MLPKSAMLEAMEKKTSGATTIFSAFKNIVLTGENTLSVISETIFCGKADLKKPTAIPSTRASPPYNQQRRVSTHINEYKNFFHNLFLPAADNNCFSNSAALLESVFPVIITVVSALVKSFTRLKLP